MELDQIFKSSDSLAADDLQGSDVVLTIKEIEIVEFDDDGYKKAKPVVRFEETDKSLVANKTNSMTIGDHHGYNTDGWVGQLITLYPTKTDFGGKMVDCIRIRPPTTGKTVLQGLPSDDDSVGHVNQDIKF